MRFYVPEWEDHVDAQYDFIHDEHSVLNRRERELAYIWDIFDRSTIPIDGVLLSREQVEESPAKIERLTSYGIYEDPMLDLPKWLPTISDCGAWGYKTLPFPPYGNADMLKFYENVDVSVGVTIDHLVLGSGHSARLYLDERGFSDAFTPGDLPDKLLDAVDDILIDTWPEEWPLYIDQYEPSLRSPGPVESFKPILFDGSSDEIIDRLADDPRAVYRDDDMAFRYQLTLDNAAEMRELYEAGDYSFRPMVAVQGWDPDSYVKATEAVLDLNYQYIGIGGVAGSNEKDVKEIVSAVGNTVTEFEREYRTRVEAHVFGFAKTGAFETIGRSGMTSFDSASMLRAAWTGGENYHLTSERRYDALRVRYPEPSDDLPTAVEKALRAQEMLHALRAFDDGASIATALWEWHHSATKALEHVPDYLETHRWDDRYEASRLRDIEAAFRDHYKYGRELKASFSEQFRGKLLKLLREDNPVNPIPWQEYLELIAEVNDVFDDRFPTLISEIEANETETGNVGTFDQLWPLVESYVACIEDENEDLLDNYKTLLQEQPWRDCSCPICTTLGIEVATFRGNNRNRRRGFHNTRRFYDEFEETLPKLLVLTKPSAQLSGANTVEAYLRNSHSDFWRAVHDLPIAEIGVITAKGIHEWWEAPPNAISFAPSEMAGALADGCIRYQDVFIDESDRAISDLLKESIESEGCTVHTFDHPHQLRRAVFDRLGFPMQSLLSGY